MRCVFENKMHFFVGVFWHGHLACKDTFQVYSYSSVVQEGYQKTLTDHYISFHFVFL